MLQEYFQNHHGDWLAVDFKAAKERDELSRHFKVEGIPSFLADFGQTQGFEIMRGRYHINYAFPWCVFFLIKIYPLFFDIHTDSYIVIMFAGCLAMLL